MYLCCGLKVWWAVEGDNSGRVYVHNVFEGTTQQLPCCGTTAAVLSMGIDGSGRVWLAFQQGLLQVWCSLYHTLVAQQSSMMMADIRSASSLLSLALQPCNAHCVQLGALLVAPLFSL